MQEFFDNKEQVLLLSDISEQLHNAHLIHWNEYKYLSRML